VTFPNIDKPHFAEVTNPKTKKTYSVHNIYSMLPTCDCAWSKQGNFCKHQCKAMMVKGHEAGSIVQQCGTRAGSKWEGLVAVEEQWNLPFEAERDPLEMPELSNLALVNVPAFNEGVQENQREKYVDKSREAFLEMEKMAFESDSLAQTMQAKMNRTLHELKVQEHCQQVTGKDVLTTADMFVRPNGLTLKRRLGAIDKYHGGTRRNRVLGNYLRKKRLLDSMVSNWFRTMWFSASYILCFSMPFLLFR
jgi:hypothetical protein